MYSLSPGSNYQPEKKLLVLLSLKRLSMCVCVPVPSLGTPRSVSPPAAKLNRVETV